MEVLKKRNKYHNNKIKTILLVVLLFIGIGFAIISTTVGFNGNIFVAANKWDVHFDNLIVNSGSVTPTKESTMNSEKTNINFGVEFTKPGDYYEFEVGVVNNGTIDAMLSLVNLQGLTKDNQKYLGYTYTYADGAEINLKDALPAGESERIKVRVEFLFDVNNKDLPTEEVSVDFNYEMKYVQDMGEGQGRQKSLLTKIKENNNWIIDNTLDFTDSTLAGTAGYYIRTGTESDSYPIMYYRGAVDNNNVIFVDICWQIVRTTETGGIKLVYNGIPTEGKCTATGEDTQMPTQFFADPGGEALYPHTILSPYSSLYGKALYVGYMINDNLTENTSDDWEKAKLPSKEVNVEDSDVKKEIDAWYKENIIGVGTSMLEDAVWCNDRSKNTLETSTEDKIYFGSYSRHNKNIEAPSAVNYLVKDNEACPNKLDRFTVKDTLKGKGALTYPVGLLTADEVSLAGLGAWGYNSLSWLNNGIPNLTMTPSHYEHGAISVIWYDQGIGHLQIYSLNVEGVRPAVSLKFGVMYKDGDGTKENPYTLKVRDSELAGEMV